MVGIVHMSDGKLDAGGDARSFKWFEQLIVYIYDMYYNDFHPFAEVVAVFCI